MQRYDPERMELSTRDRVALANYTEIAEGRGTPNGGVYLDVSHLPKSLIIEKLPKMYRQFVEIQMLDISKEPMEIAPTAHYTMGGIVVEPETHATDVEGLDVSPTSEGYGDLVHALDLRGSLVAAEATLLGAIERRETRGAHNRSDYPELDPELTVNFVVTMDGDGKLSMSPEEVHPVPEYLQEWTKRADREEYRVPGRLVE